MTTFRQRLTVQGGYTAVLAIVLGVVVIPPAVLLLYTSFRTAAPGNEAAWTLQNWRELFLPENLEPLKNSLVIAAVTSLISVPVAFFFAWVELQTDTPLVRRLGSVLIIPLVFSPLLTTIAWTILASPRAGVVNIFGRQVLGVETLFNIYSMAGIVFVSVLYFVPIAYLTLRSSLKNIDASTFEAARSSGASVFAATRRVLIPLMTPAIGAAILLTFTLNIGLFSVVTLLGPTAHVNTLQLDVYFSMVEAPTDPSHAAAIAMLLLLITLLNLAIYRRFLVKPKRYVTISGRGFRSNRVKLGPWRWATFAVVQLYVALAVVVPYLALVYAALSPFLSERLNLGNLGLRNFEMFFSRTDMVNGLRNTLLLVLVGAAITTVVAVSVGYLVRRSEGIASRSLETISLLPLAIPHLSYALGLLWFVLSVAPLREHLYGTIAVLYLAQLASFLPLGVQIVASGVVQLGEEVEDAARVCGASGAARMRRVVLPLLLPTVASAWIVLALYASVEAGLSIFLFTGQSVTTAVNVFNNALFGLPNVMYAGSFILATFGLVAIAVGNWAFGTGKYLQNSSGRGN
jgi:iron(III) transport system permease protein